MRQPTNPPVKQDRHVTRSKTLHDDHATTTTKEEEEEETTTTVVVVVVDDVVGCQRLPRRRGRRSGEAEAVLRDERPFVALTPCVTQYVVLQRITYG